MLDHRLRRWLNTVLTLAGRLVFAGGRVYNVTEWVIWHSAHYTQVREPCWLNVDSMNPISWILAHGPVWCLRLHMDTHPPPPPPPRPSTIINPAEPKYSSLMPFLNQYCYLPRGCTISLSVQGLHTQYCLYLIVVRILTSHYENVNN